MTIIDPQTTLGELVTRRPALAPLLDQLGLDYCCGGQRTLDAAAQEAGVGLDPLIEQLSTVDEPEAPVEWAELGPGELVDHLEATHHAYLDDALPRLEALAVKVAGVHGERHPELGNVERLVHELRADLEPHLRKEEQVLFPMIRELTSAVAPPQFHCGTLANPISVMLAEHDRAGELLAELRTTAADYVVPDDGCASYQALYAGLDELEADTHLHVHKENNLLFPAVLDAERRLAATPR
ncbi:MAG: iron-sulfur cluster repair di-iron protein [Acidimicrobiales bacterium]|nr:iron-sulfur cluster repair di-iron protein [Acidimicrobiales bacterium]